MSDLRSLLKRVPGLVRGLYALRKIRAARQWRNRSPQEVFTKIYHANGWEGRESVSGTGSDHAQTARLRAELPALLRELGVRRVLDVPCGDFRWMPEVLSACPEVDYVGGDIVGELIAQNRTRAARPGVRFEVVDLLGSDPLPAADLLLVRDCLVHFSEEHVQRALTRLAASGAQWLLTTTFPDLRENYDIWTGQWRPLNLERAPYGLPAPTRLLLEGCTEGDGRFADKALGLWSVAMMGDRSRR
ncbi:MAG: class I SAM-dependent methyltransferase [Verrucomicrobia bacterium]|nr:class I SAM-dependent methyltransferase [Verrucomicrobiota bacterium]